MLCPNLETFEVEEGNPNYYVKNNCLIQNKTADYESMVVLFGTKNSVIPTDSSITRMGFMAFSGVTMNELVVPSNITIKNSIESYFFASSHIKKLIFKNWDYNSDGLFGFFRNADIDNIILENYSSSDYHYEKNKYFVVNNILLEYWGNETTFVVPDGVDRIYTSAFYHDEVNPFVWGSSIKEIKYNGSLDDLRKLYDDDKSKFMLTIVDDEFFGYYLLEKITYKDGNVYKSISLEEFLSGFKEKDNSDNDINK